MPEIRISGNLNFGNPFAPCTTLIKKVLEKLYGNKINEAYIIPFSGGLSGANVAAVFTGGGQEEFSPIVVKIDIVDNIKTELNRYNFIKDKIGISRNAQRAAKCIFPPDQQSYTPIIEEGDDLKEYSVIAYNYLGDGQDRRIYSLEKSLQELIIEKNMDNQLTLLERFHQQLEGISGTLFNIFSHQKRSIKREPLFGLSKIPWETFLPLATNIAGIIPEWFDFVSNLFEKWRKVQTDIDSPVVSFTPKVCHGDLRCANILVVKSGDNYSTFLIDYGLTGYHHPLIDMPRLEADILLRIASRLDVNEYKEILSNVVEREKLIPEDWGREDRHVILQIIFRIRQIAKRIAEVYYINGYKPEEVYRHFLLGHAARMARLEDPYLRHDRKRHYYLWFALSLAANLLGHPAPLIPPANEPSYLMAQDMTNSGVIDFFWGGNRRNPQKEEVLLSESLTIDLLAHTGKSYLDDTTSRKGRPSGIFFEKVSERLGRERNNRIRIVLLNPFSVEGSKLGIAEARGDLRGPELDVDYHEEKTELFSRFKKCLDSYQKLKEKYKDKIELRITHYSPDVTLLISDDVAFIEPYVVGRVAMRYWHEIKMNAPELLIKKDTELYKVAKEQFKFFWERSIDVEEFKSREMEFKDDFRRFERLRRSLISLHESWFAVDPVVGCPNRCDYCFLTPYKINDKAPYLFRSAQNTYNRLKGNTWFKAQESLRKEVLRDDSRLPVPIACGNYTEMTNSSKSYHLEEGISLGRQTNNLQLLKELILEHEQLGVEPPILCLITKQRLPGDLIDFLGKRLSDNTRLRIAVFVSLSFLPREIESGASLVPDLLENFEVLSNLNRDVGGGAGKTCRIAGIHFWRPLLKGFHDDRNRLVEQIRKVRDKKAVSSVAVGLKVSKRLAEKIRTKGGLCNKRGTRILSLDLPAEIPEKSSDFFNQELRNLAIQVGKDNSHPVFLHTSCAVSHAFGRPDYNATYDGIINPFNPETIALVMFAANVPGDKWCISYKEVNGLRRAFIKFEDNYEIAQEAQTFLRQMLGMEVDARIKTTHEWKGSVAKPNFGEYCNASFCPEKQRNICKQYYESRLR